ncbi:MAG: D-alanyl-D-alanine carboxypeptidase family protein [Selenomonadaceae bacterium]|nr:D-alanyl-D-alanine carboxypeptidase family protein [Selenomonadaceae bacterium]
MNSEKAISAIAPPRPLIDIKKFLPAGISPNQNGIIPADKLKRIHCGGHLYIDAARSWLAMIRAATQDNIFLNLNRHFFAYRNIARQTAGFKERFIEVDPKKINPADKVIRVEWNGKLWQLKDDASFIEIPEQSSHGYGLAIYIRNAAVSDVKAWLKDNAEQFGFVEEYDFEPGHFVYVKARESIPERVLEIESLPPEPKYTAEQIIEATGCHWFSEPPKDWFCNGIFYTRPLRAGYLAVVDQGLGTGLNERFFKTTFRQFAGFICTEPEKLEKYNQPMLVTSNPQETVDKLSAFFEKCAAETSAEESNIISSPLQGKLDFYKRVNPETLIFQRKKSLSERLLKISVDDLQNAPEQSWYGEYLALLAIRLQNPILKFMGEKYTENLLQRYNQNTDTNERELAILGMLQFTEPTKLPVLFHQHLWNREMIADVQGIFSRHSLKVSYMDDEISTYYLSLQSARKHGKRKMRVAFLVQSSSVTFDKMQPLYEALKLRDDTEVFIVIYPEDSYEYSEIGTLYFKERYPNDAVYDSCSLMDLKKLRPDYVFYGTPYEKRMPFPSFGINDVIQFAKVCHITYGANLAQNFIDNLLDKCWSFYSKIYFLFCSGATVTDEMTEKYRENIELGYQHFEFLGYPILERYYQMPASESSVKRILWTPRWSCNERVGGSHFMNYKDKFIGLRSKYGDSVELTMRPHMNTFKAMEKSHLMTEDEIENYKRTLEDNRINLDSLYRDNETIRNTDIFLTDYSSIIIELFLTGRPIVYCEFPNAIILPEYEEMFKAMYIARTWEDVERYLDDLIAGNDPLFEKRQEVAKQIYELHEGATQKIVKRLVQDFKESERD